MLRNLCDSPIHKWLSASLAFIFLFLILLSLPVGAADPIRPNDTVGWKEGDNLANVISVILDSWGISFSTGLEDLDLSIPESVDEFLQQFYESQNVLADEFWKYAQLGADKFGNLIANNTTISNVIRFAEWLVDAYDLQDNDHHYTGLPAGYFLSDGTPIIFADSSNTLNGTSFSFNTQYVTSLGTTFSFNSSSSIITFSSSAGFRFSQNSDVAPYMTRFMFIKGGDIVFEIGYGTDSSIVRFLSNVNIASVLGPPQSPSSGIYIDTVNINIPQNVSPDDGYQITVPGTDWGDSLFEILDLIARLIGLYDTTQLEIIGIIDTLEDLIANLQNPISIENIPGAVTLDYDEYDIPLETEWGLIDDFYGLEFSEDDTLFTPFDTIKSLIFGLPEPLLLFLSVIIVWIVAYGFIRMGRDSH